MVIPTLFGSVEAVHEALENLEVQFLANREAHLHFAVLSDFTDAPRRPAPGDGAIIAAAVAGVRALNARYAQRRADDASTSSTARGAGTRPGRVDGMGAQARASWPSSTASCAAARRDAFSAIVGDIGRSGRCATSSPSTPTRCSRPTPRRSSSARWPIRSTARCTTPARGRVVRGYGILQPRVGVSLPSAQPLALRRDPSRAHPGVDPYTTAVSDVYQDLYGEGSFTGKGIYDVDAFERATRGRFPENTLLSHDLIEGSYARAGLATDIKVYDDYPAALSRPSPRRKHRWIRGDWQLLRWLRPAGARPRRPASATACRCSRAGRSSTTSGAASLEIAQLAFLVAGWMLLPGSPLRWTLLAAAARSRRRGSSRCCSPSVRPPLDKSWRAYYGDGRPTTR